MKKYPTKVVVTRNSNTLGSVSDKPVCKVINNEVLAAVVEPAVVDEGGVILLAVHNPLINTSPSVQPSQ